MTLDVDRGIPAAPTPSHVPAAGRAPVHAAVVRALLRRIVAGMDLQVRMPDGSVLGSRQAGVPVMEIVDGRFFDRVGRDLKIGVGEGFMAREWRPGASTDLADVLTPFAERLTDIVPEWLRRFRQLVEPRHPRHEANDPSGARVNIARHYDLSNDVFAAFLDETMSYSSAWFGGDRGVSFAGLAEAQRRKIDGVLDFAGVQAGSRVLEIGSGWGELAIQAARRGAFVHTITLSREQQTLARRRIADAGLTDRVLVDLRDYREVDGRYDAVVSVEMIEAVGEAYWPTYFAAVSGALDVGGRFGLQAITMPHDRMLASRHAYSWVHKYIFPGGLIPSLEAISAQARAAGLRIGPARSLGPDYAHTLRLWRERFLSRQDEVRALGFDETFIRVWEFYLAYSEAGFRSGHLDVWQLGLEKMR
ncbi:MAG: cyclopropane-fatty-acyl-phospholipid synthase family protein [Dermatophilaceae bacterium]